MKFIYIIGLGSHEKYWFINYFGKLLSTQGKVIVRTDTDFISLRDQEPIEKSHQMDFVKRSYRLKKQAYTFVIEDVEKEIDTLEKASTVIFMTSPRRDHLIKNRAIFDSIKQKWHDSLASDSVRKYFIPYNMVLDSKISIKYLEFWFHELFLDEEVKTFILPFNEWDWMLSIENDYEDKIRLKNLSKHYKQLLNDLLLEENLVSKKDLRKLIRKAERG